MARTFNPRITAETSTTVNLVDFKAFSRGLRAAGDAFPAELRAANYKFARNVIGVARGLAGSLRSSNGVHAKAAKSLRVVRSLTSVAIEGGGPRYPYFYGAEFGAKQYGQFPRWRGNQHKTTWEGGPGYFLHPAIRVEGPRSLRDYMKTIDDLTDRAFPA